MTCQSGDFLHAWLFPNIYLVQRVPMSRHYFICCFREHQVANLRPSVNVVDWLQAVGVPEPDASVCSTATRGQETILIWIPGNCFYCGLMLTEFCLSTFRMLVPNHQFVIISSACELLAIEGPLKATYFLLMPSMSMSDAIACSQVSA